MELQLFLILMFIGLAVSLFGNMVGFGGGLFLVPILIIFFKYEIGAAVSTSLLAIFPSALVATILNSRRKLVLFRLGILLEIPTIIGTIIGSLLVAVLPVTIMKIIFVVFVVILGLYMLLKLGGNGKSNWRILERINSLPPIVTLVVNKENHLIKRISFWMISFFGLMAGFLAGLFGIGGGFLKTPVMIKVFGVQPTMATATALFMIIITAFVGTATHYLSGKLHTDMALPIVVGFILGSTIASYLHVRLKDAIIERMVGFALILAGVSITINIFMH